MSTNITVCNNTYQSQDNFDGKVGFIWQQEDDPSRVNDEEFLLNLERWANKPRL